MDWNSLIYFVFIPLGVYVYRKIETIEQDVMTKTNDDQVKEIVKDKLLPIEEKLDDIKAMLDKLVDIQLKK